MVKYPQYIHPNNSMQFISDDNGETHNLCQFWSNFEITDMEFFRGRAYRQFFNYLDSTGGFFTARWGDAPVHSIAAALFLDRKDIKFWDDIGKISVVKRIQPAVLLSLLSPIHRLHAHIPFALPK
jgi:alpha 1,2-mannosyltransferase